MKELVDLPWMAPILDIYRLGPSNLLRELLRFKKLYLTAKLQAWGKLFDGFFAVALGMLGKKPPGTIIAVVL